MEEIRDRERAIYEQQIQEIGQVVMKADFTNVGTNYEVE